MKRPDRRTGFLLILGVLVLLVPVATPLSCNRNPEPEYLYFFELNTEGLRSDTVPGQELVISDQESLNEFWATYGSGAAPQLDFDAWMVAGVFLGARPNQGYSVEIHHVRKYRGTTTVYYAEDLPEPGVYYPAVESYPYDMVYLERVSGEINFAG